MVLRLQNILKSYSDLEYRIVENITTRFESYYVRQSLEMNRTVDVTHVYLTIYKIFEENGEKYRGSSDTEIHPTASDEEIKKQIESAAFAASFVKNKYYPLVEASNQEIAKITSDFEEMGLESAVQKMTHTVFALDKHDKGYLSYSEYFISRKKTRLVNSLGVDYSFTGYYFNMETAVNWKDGKEIEIYESCRLASCDTEFLSNFIKKMFTVAKSKPLAVPMPAVKDVNFLLTGECLSEFFSYYRTNADAVNVYNRMSTYKVGDDLQGDSVEGDKITMILDPLMEGSDLSRPFDQDGLVMKPVKLIEDGKLLAYCGDTRNSSYLGTQPTGSIRNVKVSGGTMNVADMKKSPYLELLSFSGFQANPLTGDFSSEIRLGFYFDGEKTFPVTGGSISGNIKNVHGNMRMSVETSQFNNYVGPSTIMFKNAAIAAVE